MKNDLTNKKFGRLRVVSYVCKDKNNHNLWLCKCDCGNEKVILGNSLVSNHTKSCGCYDKERRKKYNKYDLSNEFGIGYTNKGTSFIFDKEDFDKIKDYCWHLDSDGYLVAYGKERKVKFHRLIFGENNSIIDHINGNKKDNRKCNLRNVTSQQNSFNRSHKSNNSSGFLGITKLKTKYSVSIRVNGILIKLGSFKDFNDAVNARIDAENKYFGQYARKGDFYGKRKENNRTTRTR